MNPMRRSTAVLLPSLSLAGLLVAAVAGATGERPEESSMTLQTATAATLPSAGAAESALPFALPAGFAPVAAAEVALDGQPARLLRYERADGRNAGLGGEHVSLVLGAEGRLLGYTRMDATLAARPLPDEAAAEATAVAFLERAAPELVPVRRLSWVKPHAETVQAGGRALEVTGMKVKMRNTADDTWFWVIVGPDEQIVTFERDIVWLSFPGRRQTEKWLHDAWLAEREGVPAG